MKRPILIILALAAMVGIAGLYYYQRNSYSKEILKLEILAPEEADLLEEIEYIVKYKNNGNTRLEEPQLIFEFPSNSLPTEETSLRITKSLDDLGGAIYPGEEKTLHLKTRLLGKEGEAKTAKAILTYRPKNLKAYYESSTTFTTVITKVPLTFEFDLPTSIESGKDLRFQLNYFSNAEYPLSDLSVTVEYPSGFEFVDSTPSALEKTEWDVGLLNKAEGGRIEISGRLAGEIGEEKVFQAKIGSWREGEFVLIKEITKGISIAKPSLYISQQINGNPQYIASPGDLLHYQIFFKNIGEELLSNLFLIAGLEGKAFDFERLKSPEGDFDTGDNSIIFDWKRVHSLQFLDAGDEGMVEFWIKLKDEWEIKDSRDKNPTIKSKVYLSQVKEEFVNKVNSRLVISQKGYFEDEVFGNSGFIPPEVGKDTTYSITWRAENFYNDVQNVKVKATLPRNVELTGKIFPEESSSKFAFDSESREIVWEIGELKVSQGTAGTPAPNIAFQVKFTPSASQKGETPEIISQAQISGQDQWTGAILESASPAVDTSLLDDEAVDPEMGIVE